MRNSRSSSSSIVFLLRLSAAQRSQSGWWFCFPHAAVVDQLCWFSLEVLIVEWPCAGAILSGRLLLLFAWPPTFDRLSHEEDEEISTRKEPTRSSASPITGFPHHIKVSLCSLQFHTRSRLRSPSSYLVRTVGEDSRRQLNQSVRRVRKKSVRRILVFDRIGKSCSCQRLLATPSILRLLALS